jgi:hypothetical protein
MGSRLSGNTGAVDIVGQMIGNIHAKKKKLSQGILECKLPPFLAVFAPGHRVTTVNSPPFWGAFYYHALGD